MAAPYRSPIINTRTLPKPRGSVGSRFRMTARSGLLTTVAAKTASAGHIAAFRNTSTTKSILVDRVRLDGSVITDFTTLQRLGFGLFIARGYTASHSGGTAQTLTGNNGKLRTSDPAISALGDFRIGDTGALTAGTHTLDAQPVTSADFGVPSDGATVENKALAMEFSGDNGPIVLAQDEGLVLANMVLMGAAGTVALDLTIDWREVLNAEVLA